MDFAVHGFHHIILKLSTIIYSLSCVQIRVLTMRSRICAKFDRFLSEIW